MSERNTHFKAGLLIGFLVAASTLIEAGKMVAVNAAGYLVEATDVAAIIVVGIANQTIDNSTGANGDLTCLVKRGELYKLRNSGTAAVTQVSVGSNVYVEDDETVAIVSGPTNDIVAGKCLGVESDGVWVAIN
ncbi:MAG: hypothetical protein L3J57_13940 [Desulfuromusa sp.]|nr:hypothetical protein [Desulfuromusa sp.]